jgi:hypothetical protein
MKPEIKAGFVTTAAIFIFIFMIILGAYNIIVLAAFIILVFVVMFFIGIYFMALNEFR